MFFTFLLGLSAFLVAGSAAYFSVLGIATLFSGSYYQVIIMAGALEFGKLVATSYLYRYWNKTVWWLKTYLIIAVLTLMGITSMGIFGYLSAAYQVNSSKFAQLDTQTALIESQKNTFEQEIQQNLKRIEMLNEVRATQELRVQEAGNYRLPREQAYAAIDKANQEIQTLTQRNQVLQGEKFKKDSEIITINQQVAQVKDVGTFKFIAETVNRPLDTVVIVFICILICVFDPLAVSLVLAFNVASTGKLLKEKPVFTEPKTQITSEEKQQLNQTIEVQLANEQEQLSETSPSEQDILREDSLKENTPLDDSKNIFAKITGEARLKPKR